VVTVQLDVTGRCAPYLNERITVEMVSVDELKICYPDRTPFACRTYRRAE